MLWKSQSENHTQWWKTESILSKMRNKAKMLTLPLPFNIALEVLPRAIRQEKWIQNIQIGKEEIKLYVCRQHDLICRKFSRFYPKIVRTDKWIQSNCRIQKQTIKSVVFLYTNKEQSQNEI